jgi:hypothetical protein
MRMIAGGVAAVASAPTAAPIAAILWLTLGFLFTHALKHC